MSGDMLRISEKLTLVFSLKQQALIAGLRQSDGYLTAVSDDGEVVMYTEFLREGCKPHFDDAEVVAVVSDIRMVYDEFHRPNDEHMWEEWGFTPSDSEPS
ncbi:MAG: hypothetical protein GC137_08120 [Alphaproteobacteria bacterium]|nr:hypothetical protein [Alphaproteobacteria bacterium]